MSRMLFRRSLPPILALVMLTAQLSRLPATAAEPPAVETEGPPQMVRIVAAGDIMMHMPLVKAAFRQKTGDYDFGPVFAEIAPLVQKADLALANLETTFAREGKYTGYPRFNSPRQLAEDLKRVGFDLLVTANNHALDYGEKGILNTWKTLSAAGLRSLGTYPDAKSRKPCLVERKGIRIGLLAYTCLTNGRRLPPGKDYLLNLYSPARVAQDVAALKKQGSELIICYLHFGQEFQRYPDQSQVKIVEFLKQQGIDVILGSHPHVVQPGTLRNQDHQLVVYSLGNLVSCQRSNYTDVGVLVEITVVKNQGKASVSGVDYIPTYVVYKWKHNRPTYHIRLAKTIDGYLTRRYAARLRYHRKSFYDDMLAHLIQGLSNRDLYAGQRKATGSATVQALKTSPDRTGG